MFISRVFDETLVIFVFASQLLCTVYFVCVQYGQILLQLPRAFAFHHLCLPLDRFNCTNIFTKQNKLFEQLYRNIRPAQLATLDSSTSYIYRLDYVYLNSSVGESLIQNKFWKDQNKKCIKMLSGIWKQMNLLTYCSSFFPSSLLRFFLPISRDKLLSLFSIRSNETICLTVLHRNRAYLCVCH